MSEYGDSFVGGNFLWFTGVIEDVNDPEEMGRYRVRCFGYHTEDKGRIKTEDLPWANVMMPVTSASTSGIGYSATGLVQGSWVIGFFRDGGNVQDPVIMGSIPSMFEARPEYSAGFSDPDKVYPLADTVGKPDTPQPARKDYKDSEVYKSKKSRKSSVSTVSTAGGGSWTLSDPASNIVPMYPNNHVYQSESGHVVEFDDTSGKERISLFHKSGSYDEVVNSGDRSIVIVGDSYEVVIKNKNIYIKGDLNLNVDGNMNTKVSKNYKLEVLGDMETTVSGTQNITASVTNINNNVNVTGTLTATVDVIAGSNSISLVKHTHLDNPGVKAGITSKPL
jgi:hypothetical protein